MEESGITSTKSAVARSWLGWGRAVETPYRGCIVILSTSDSKWQGHVGFFIGNDPKDTDKIWVLGGNQSDRVCIDHYPRERVLGYRVPALNS